MSIPGALWVHPKLWVRDVREFTRWETDRRIASGQLLDAQITAGRPVRRRNSSILWFRLLLDANVLIDALEAVAGDCREGQSRSCVRELARTLKVVKHADPNQEQVTEDGCTHQSDAARATRTHTNLPNSGRSQ